MLEDDERYEEPPPRSKMNLADGGVQTKKTVKMAAMEEVIDSSDSESPQKVSKASAKKQTAKSQPKAQQSNKTKTEKAAKTSKAKDSAEEPQNPGPTASYEPSPSQWPYPTYDEWQAQAMSAMQYALAPVMPTMPPRPNWPPRPMYQAPWPPAPPEQGRERTCAKRLPKSADCTNTERRISSRHREMSAVRPRRLHILNVSSVSAIDHGDGKRQAGVAGRSTAAPIDSQETQSIDDSSAEDSERVVEVVYTEKNELPEEDDWKESPDKQIETKAIVGQIMQEAEEYSKNSLAKVVSAKATREAEKTREESSGRPPTG
ncbi:unnamed protein product [Trichogramma brassicae]|uniref:Uncharacterized protein n=1 Tax=Trichogramma brassicae TaxID=86971 RepID=A0A6H5I9D8_9HYME|nr:unnamed protein product [Trichogramma brassicae]